jgi:hypothetical protein
MVGTTDPATEFVLSAHSRVFLRTTRDRYPYAYGYLRNAVNSYLDGAAARPGCVSRSPRLRPN